MDEVRGDRPQTRMSSCRRVFPAPLEDDQRRAHARRATGRASSCTPGATEPGLGGKPLVPAARRRGPAARGPGDEQRHHRTEGRRSGQSAPRGRAAPLAEDGGDRHPGRGHRARLQQHPRRDPRLRRARAAQGRRDRPAARESGPGDAGGQPRQAPGGAHPRVQPQRGRRAPPGARAVGRRGDARPARGFPSADDPAGEDAARRRCGRGRRRHAAPPGDDEPLHQRGPGDAEGRRSNSDARAHGHRRGARTLARHARPRAPTSGCRSPTPAPASRPRCWNASSIRSSPPRGSAKAPASDFRWCTASSPTSGASWTWKPARAPAPLSRSGCPPPTRPRRASWTPPVCCRTGTARRS